MTYNQAEKVLPQNLFYEIDLQLSFHQPVTNVCSSLDFMETKSPPRAIHSFCPSYQFLFLSVNTSNSQQNPMQNFKKITCLPS